MNGELFDQAKANEEIRTINNAPISSGKDNLATHDVDSLIYAKNTMVIQATLIWFNDTEITISLTGGASGEIPISAIRTPLADVLPVTGTPILMEIDKVAFIDFIIHA